VLVPLASKYNNDYFSKSCSLALKRSKNSAALVSSCCCCTILTSSHFHNTRRTSGQSLGSLQVMLSSLLHKTITTPLLFTCPAPRFSWVRCQISQCDICGGPSGRGTGFPPVLLSSPVSIIPPMLRTLLRRTNGRSLGTFTEAAFFPGNMGPLYRKAISLLFALKGISCYSRQFFPYNRSCCRVP
jgi:hypothetical protein